MRQSPEQMSRRTIVLTRFAVFFREVSNRSTRHSRLTITTVNATADADVNTYPHENEGGSSTTKIVRSTES